MGKALFDYMNDCNTRDDLYDSLLPQTRTIHMYMHDEDNISGTIGAILSLTRNSLEQHQQPINMLIKTQRDGKSSMSLKFPAYGLYSSIAAQQNSNKVAIMLNLLRTIQECITTGTTKTNRDVFYSNVELYGKQGTVDRWLNVVAQCFEVTHARDALNVVPAQKGLVFSTKKIRIFNKGNEESILPYQSSLIPHMNPNSVCQILSGRYDNIHLLVLEKEAVYNQLVDSIQHNVQRNSDSSSCNDYIIVTGKGYPDFLTRLFLHKLQVSTAIYRWEIYTDADPYGIDIAMKYVDDSKGPYRCDKLNHKGVFLFQLMSKNYRQVQYLPMTQRDTTVASRILKRMTESNNPKMATIQELQRQIFLQKKAEMNIMSREAYLWGQSKAGENHDNIKEAAYTSGP